MRNWHFSNFYFFYFTSVGIIVPYWSLYLKHKGFGAAEIGQLMAVLLMTKVVAPNIWAAIADNMAIRRGSALGMLKYAATATLLIYSSTFWVSSFWSMALSMFGFCVFWNACLPQIEAATLNHLAENRDQYGLIRLWGSVGFIVTVLGVGWLMDYTGPGAIMPAGACALSLLLLASLLMRDRARQTNAQLPISETVRVVLPLAQLLNAKVLTLLFLCILMQISHAPFYTFFSIYLESYGYSKLHIGWLWSAGVIFEIMVFIFGYRLLRRFKLSSLLSFTFIVAAIRWLIVAALPEQQWMIFFSQALHAITYGLYHSVMIQLIDRLFQGRYQIRGQALYSSVTFGLGGAIGSFVSGSIWVVYGQNQLFYAAALMMVLVFVFSLIICPRITGEVTPTKHHSN
jgi:PPP family 3-phenylpropionic acid transporter